MPQKDAAAFRPACLSQYLARFVSPQRWCPQAPHSALDFVSVNILGSRQAGAGFPGPLARRSSRPPRPAQAAPWSPPSSPLGPVAIVGHKHQAHRLHVQAAHREQPRQEHALQERGGKLASPPLPHIPAPLHHTTSKPRPPHTTQPKRVPWVLAHATPGARAPAGTRAVGRPRRPGPLPPAGWADCCTGTPWACSPQNKIDARGWQRTGSDPAPSPARWFKGGRGI